MDIDVFKAHELEMVFRVVRTALSPHDSLAASERKFLATYARITGYMLLGDPVRIRAGEVQLSGGRARKRLVQLAAMAALLSAPVRRESAEFVAALSRRLSAPEPVIGVLRALANGQRLKAKLLARRRAFGALAKEAYLKEGFFGIVRFFSALFLGARVNGDRMWRYKRLGLLPEGTLGREYWKHLTELGFGFPGEPAGIPDSVAYHDIAHVLAEHDTTPLGEIQQGAFQGGNRRDDGFFFVQFVILQFHHGIGVTPVAPPQTGQFDPEKVLWAIYRGAKCSVDVTHQWDFWPLMALPLDEARARIHLLPKLS